MPSNRDLDRQAGVLDLQAGAVDLLQVAVVAAVGDVVGVAAAAAGVAVETTQGDKTRNTQGQTGCYGYNIKGL